MVYDFKFFAFLFIGLYLGILVLTGLWFSRKEAGQDFIIADRKVGIIPTAASLAASFRDGGGIVLWIAAGFAASYANLWLLVGLLLCTVMLAWIGPKLRAEAKETGIITIQERVAAFIGPVSAKLSAGISLVFGLLVIAIQYHVTGNIFSEILHVPDYVGVAVVFAILTLYLLTGGYKSVIVTDTIQFFVMFSLILIPFFLNVPADKMMNMQTFIDGNENTLALFLLGIYYLLVSPECWQRIFSAKDDRTVRVGLPLTAFVLVIMTLSLIWLGMGAKEIFPDIASETAYSLIFQDNPQIAPWLLGYILVVFLSITMSTQSAACYSFVSTLAKIFFPHKTRDDRAYIKFSRVAMFACLLLSGVISLTIHQAVQFLFDAVGFVTCLAPAYVLSVIINRFPAYSRLTPSDKSTLDRIIAGAAALGILAFILSMVFQLSDNGIIYSVLPGLGTAVLSIIGVTMFMSRQGK
jgi:SSS family solute:Na+ symporter